MTDITFILEYRGPGKGPETYDLYFCRNHDPKRCGKHQKKGRHCADCYLPSDYDITLGEIYDKIKKGDA